MPGNRHVPPTEEPTLARFIETITAVLGLRDGRLELVFRGGGLEAYPMDGGLQRPPEAKANRGEHRV